MDPLSRLLTLPLTGPLDLVIWLAEKITEQAENEMYDEDKLRGKLMELELLLDMGEINEEEYMQAEEVLLDYLKEARSRKMETEE